MTANKSKQNKRGSILSTEVGARKVMNKINTVRKSIKKVKPKNITSVLQQGDQTAKSIPGTKKTKAQGNAELKALRAKQARTKKALKAKTKVKKG